MEEYLSKSEIKFCSSYAEIANSLAKVKNLII